jgi:predicted permease
MRSDLRPGLRRLFRIPLRGGIAIHADADEELESLIAARVEHLVSRGVSPDDARAEALRKLGATLDDARRQLHHSAERRERRMTVRETFESVLQDIRFAARGLARRPAFTIVAVSTLAIGIGATTAIFSAVNALLLRPLPYARPAELMKISLVSPARGDFAGSDDMVWSYPKFVVFRDNQRVFDRVSLYSEGPFTLTDGDVERVGGEYVGAQYLRTLGLVPSLGRDFDPSVDEHPGGPDLAILSRTLWQRRYNADPSIIGRTIDVNRRPFTVVGIAPEGFAGLTGKAEVFLPVTMRQAKDDLDQPYSHEFSLVGRRKRNVSVEQAEAAVRVLGGVVNRTFSDRVAADAPWGAKARPLDDTRVAPLVKRSVFILFGAVSFVLLIACVNVASLMLGRASTRQREIAVRLATGASRGRLIRLLLTESTLLAVVGGAASLVVAAIGTRVLSGIDPTTAARLHSRDSLGAVDFGAIHLDYVAFAFTLAVAIAAGLLFGLVPALTATRSSVSDALKSGTGSRNRGRHTLSVRRVLVVSEVALALVLLAGSGLMIRSLTKLLGIDPGFDPQHVLTLRLSVLPGGAPRDSLPGFYTTLIGRLRALPGVTHVALTDCPPLNGGCNRTTATFADRPQIDEASAPAVGLYWGTPDLLATLGTPLRRGRTFAETDRRGAPKVVIVNEAAARRFWPGMDPIGKRIGVNQGGFGSGAEVIGVAGDVRQFADSVARPEVYLPFAQSPRAGMMILIRTTGDPAALASTARRAVQEVAPGYPVFDIQPLSRRSAAATAQARFAAELLATFAVVALVLSAIGIYGVLSLAVAARTREIGIRMALGAEQHRVRGLVIGEGVSLAAVGAALGIAGALVSTRVLRTMLFDLTPNDPVTYVGIVLVLATAVMLATWLPARRAARVDPVVALRAE